MRITTMRDMITHTTATAMRAMTITAMKAIRSVIEQADSRREPIRQVDGEQIKQEQIRERGRLT